MINIEDIKVKTSSCIKNGKEQKELDRCIALYVVPTRECNAQCEFCEFRGKTDRIDLDKFKETYMKLLDNMSYITTVHFTGGEPTLELETIKEICKFVKSTNELTSTSVNTNGIKLNELANIEYLDNIALSRHGLTDLENYEIFKTRNIATESDIRSFPKNKLHLSCNLIKGHIDSEDKIYQYLEKYSALGVYDVGFVGLMNINNYCKDNYIEFPELSRCTATRRYQNIENETEYCRCKNWLYRAKNCNLVSLYHRHVLKNSDAISSLVYENNQLYAGFNGEEVQL